MVTKVYPGWSIRLPSQGALAKDVFFFILVLTSTKLDKSIVFPMSCIEKIEYCRFKKRLDKTIGGLWDYAGMQLLFLICSVDCQCVERYAEGGVVATPR